MRRGSAGYRGLSPTVNIVPPLRGYVYEATYQRNGAYRMLFLCRHYVAWEGGRVNVRGLRCATPTVNIVPSLRGYDTKPAFQKMSKNRKVGNEETPKNGKSAERQGGDTEKPKSGKSAERITG